MQSYLTQTGCMGYVAGHWMLFATENEYYEYVMERTTNETT